MDEAGVQFLIIFLFYVCPKKVCKCLKSNLIRPEKKLKASKKMRSSFFAQDYLISFDHVTLNSVVVPYIIMLYKKIPPPSLSFFILTKEKMQLKSTFFFSVFILLSNWCYCQLLLPFSNCTAQQTGLCDLFLLEGGLNCQRNNQTLCFKPSEQNNVLNLTTSPELYTEDLCTQNATYNCRTFIQNYGVLCNLFECIQSNSSI